MWLEDCHGDSYDTVPLGGVVYLAGHPYYCGNIGGFPDTYPNRVPRRAIAFSAAATGTVATNTHDTFKTNNWGGQPAPTLQTWFPAIAAGTFTGQFQGTWSTTGNDRYIAFGGEFPRVNGTPQQGLVRFALPGAAPNRVGPAPDAARLAPRVVSLASGTARVAWTTTADRDNLALTYLVFRDGQLGVPVHTMTVPAPDWNPATVGFTDTGLAPGSSHFYQVYVRDPFGNVTAGPATAVTVAGNVRGPYARQVLASGPTHYWRLGEPSGGTGYDSAGVDDLSLGTGSTRGTAGALRDPGADRDLATSFTGVPTAQGVADLPEPAPDAFSVQAWFRTTSTVGGPIIGFGNTAAAAGTASTVYDRQVYLDSSGRLRFGVYNGRVHTIAGPRRYNDGAWHQVVATFGSGGLALFADGQRIANDPTTTSAKPYTGYWHLGGNTLRGWPYQPGRLTLAGDLDEVAVYPSALDSTVVAAQYAHRRLPGRRTSRAHRPLRGRLWTADRPAVFWRLDETGAATTAVDSSGHNDPGTYLGPVRLGVPSPVTGPLAGGGSGTAAGLSQGVQIVSSRAIRGPQTFSVEAWFRHDRDDRRADRRIRQRCWRSEPSRRPPDLDARRRPAQFRHRHRGGEPDHHGGAGTTTARGTSWSGRWGQPGLALWGRRGAGRREPDAGRRALHRLPAGRVRTGWPPGASTPWFDGAVDEVAAYPGVLSPDRIRAHYLASPGTTYRALVTFGSTSAAFRMLHRGNTAARRACRRVVTTLCC